jgi:3-deoxy-manno-octulosonate cytidylyltransferase (CMP-KDO synthetase)
MPGREGGDVCIIIPARYASTRYPGKPLVALKGASGQPMTLVERSWRAARAVPGAARVLVATDDDRIAAEVTRFGGEVVMTPTECRNGTERCAAAVAALGIAPEIIVNLQGDAPLTPAYVVEALLAHLGADPDCPVATPAIRCSSGIYAHLVADQNAGRVGGTTVVRNAAGDALYFSKRVLPYLPAELPTDRPIPAFLHMGVYAYRASALAAYAAMPPSELELLEGLEQLRFLHGGVRVAAVECASPAWDAIELNNPSDIAPVEAMLQRAGID